MSPNDIKSAREKLGLSLRDLATKAGISASTISRIENGKEATYSNLIRLHEALNLDFPEMELQPATIEERRLIAAWRDKDYGLVLLMVARRLDHSED